MGRMISLPRLTVYLPLFHIALSVLQLLAGSFIAWVSNGSRIGGGSEDVGPIVFTLALTPALAPTGTMQLIFGERSRLGAL